MSRKILFLLLLFPSQFLIAQTETGIDSLLTGGQNIQYQSPYKADSIFLEALQKSDEASYLYGKGMAHKGLGVVADLTDQAEKSIYHYNQSFEFFCESQDTLDAYKARFNEGMIYRKLGMFQQAELIFLETAEVFRQYSFPIGIVLCNTNYGISLYDRGKHEEALQVFIDVKNASEEVQFISPNTYGNIGNCYLKIGELDSSMKYLNIAFDIAESAQDVNSIVGFGPSLAGIHIERKQWNAAIKLLERSANLAAEHGMIQNEIQSNSMLHLCYAKTSSFDKAYYSLLDLKVLEDSVSNTSFLLNLSEKEAVIENEKSQSEIKILLEKEKVSLAERERDQAALRGLIIGGGLLAIIIILVLLQNIKKRKTNRLLELKNSMIEEQHQEIRDSINYAQQIQAAILTSENEWSKIAKEHFIFFQPKDVVSGDFFWAYQNEERNLAIWVAADCTGHGVPGAFMSMLGVGLLNEIIIENKNYDTSQILNKLREKIIKALESKSNSKQRKDGMDLSICIWDKTENILQFSGANNPIYLIRKEEYETEDLSPYFKMNLDSSNLFEIKGDKMPVGSFTEELKPFDSVKIKLRKSDIIYSFSDGLADQFGGENGKKFKYKKFRETLLQHSSKPLKRQREELERSFTEWKSDFEQVDDICVIGMQIS
jgi:serine phosphatase RsbU (regulator of sigma subunit)/tetratricopeptide (TPR) repeat protein